MSKRLRPGHFYLTGIPANQKVYCLYMGFQGSILLFEYFILDEGYSFKSVVYDKDIEDLILAAQEIPTPQIAWVQSQYSLFSDLLSGSVFTLMLFPSGVPEKFRYVIYSLEDVQRVMKKYNKITLEGIGTVVKTSKGLSCFGYSYLKEVHVLCRDFFHPFSLLAEFGLTLEGMERFLSEGKFSSWEGTDYKPGFYGFHGVVSYLPRCPQYNSNKLYVPRFILDDELGCYTYDGFSPSSPCNLMNPMKEMYVGVRLCLDRIPNSCRGMLILSETFGSHKELMGDKVIWTEEELMENIDDLLHQNYTVEIPSFQMKFTVEDGRSHMQPTNDFVSIPEMRTMFLKQSDF